MELRGCFGGCSLPVSTVRTLVRRIGTRLCAMNDQHRTVRRTHDGIGDAAQQGAGRACERVRAHDNQLNRLLRGYRCDRSRNGRGDGGLMGNFKAFETARHTRDIPASGGERLVIPRWIDKNTATQGRLTVQVRGNWRSRPGIAGK